MTYPREEPILTSQDYLNDLDDMTYNTPAHREVVRQRRAQIRTGYTLEPEDQDPPLTVDSDWIDVLRSVVIAAVITAATVAVLVCIHARYLHH